MPGKLTVIGIGRRKAPGKLYDGEYGLFLQLYPSGAKCWQQRLTINRRRRTGGLGGYPAVSLADARAKSLQNWLVARDGADPFPKKIAVNEGPQRTPSKKMTSSHRASTRTFETVPPPKPSRAVPTFEEAADAVIENHAPTWRDPTAVRT